MNPLKRTRPTPNCVLVNFGDNMRVVYDIDNIHVNIKPGEVKAAALPDVTIEFVRRAMSTDPLCVFEDPIALPDRVKECLAILAIVSTEDYDKLLQRTTALVGKETIGTTRPSRGELMGILKPIAMVGQKVTIKEQVPNKDDPRRTPTEQRPPAPDRSQPEPAKNADDHSDGVLGTILEPGEAGKAAAVNAGVQDGVRRSKPEQVPKTTKKKRERIKI